MLVNRKSLDWDKEFQFEFGSYVQVHKENNPNNNNKARALDGIYLGPVQDNNQGGHWVMDLSTGREIKRLQVVEVVMTELVVKRVEQLASMQRFGDNLKLLDNKKRLIVPDPDLAGVDMDFQLDEFEDKDYQPPAVEEDEDLADVDDITDEEVEDLKASVITDEAVKASRSI